MTLNKSGCTDARYVSSVIRLSSIRAQILTLYLLAMTVRELVVVGALLKFKFYLAKPPILRSRH